MESRLILCSTVLQGTISTDRDRLVYSNSLRAENLSHFFFFGDSKMFRIATVHLNVRLPKKLPKHGAAGVVNKVPPRGGIEPGSQDREPDVETTRPERSGTRRNDYWRLRVNNPSCW